MENQTWNYDYSQTLWMKMYLAEPDFLNGCSKVYITFEQALDIIRKMDNLTQGIRKIVYLVGWQGLGHDDCYPEMEIVNEALKRPEDKTARESLWRLFEEAKKYHTVVSFHGNLADAYTQTPCFPLLVRENAVVKNAKGEATPIEVFNGRDGYKISYKGYFESGLFQKNWNRFCDLMPVREAGTVHIDNFCIAQSLNPYTSVEDEDAARNHMLDYIQSCGIDVTTEYTYRELEWRADSPEHPIRRFYGTAADHLPEGRWTSVLTGEEKEGGKWYEEYHDYLSIPLFAREGSVVAFGACESNCEYDYADGVTYRVYALTDGQTAESEVYSADNEVSSSITVSRSGDSYTVKVVSDKPCKVELVNTGKQIIEFSGSGEQTV